MTHFAICRKGGFPSSDWSRAAFSGSGMKYPGCSERIAQQLAGRTFTFEEFLAAEAEAGRLSLPLVPAARAVLLHGHCHQKSFGVIRAVERVLRLVPDLEVENVELSCCGMAGAFGYQADTIEISLAMAELTCCRRPHASAETIIVADGTSCRQPDPRLQRPRRTSRRPSACKPSRPGDRRSDIVAEKRESLQGQSA